MLNETNYQIFNDNRKYSPIRDFRTKPKPKVNWTFIVTWTVIITVMSYLIKTLYNLIN